MRRHAWTAWSKRVCSIEDGHAGVGATGLRLPPAPHDRRHRRRAGGRPGELRHARRARRQHGQHRPSLVGATLYLPRGGGWARCSVAATCTPRWATARWSVSGAEAAGHATVTLTALPEPAIWRPRSWRTRDESGWSIPYREESLDAAADGAVHRHGATWCAYRTAA